MEGEYPTFEEMEARLAQAEALLEARRSPPAIEPAPELAAPEPPSAATQEATPGNELKLLQALRAGRVLAFEWDVVSDRVTGSENAEEIFGLPAILMATGATFFEMVHPEDRARILQLLSTLCERGGCYCDRFRLLRPDGTILWVEESAQGEFDPSGNLILLRGLRADITERKQAEAEATSLLNATREEKERLSALINSISDEVWFADRDGKFTPANASALREFGIRALEGLEVENLAGSVDVCHADGSPRALEDAPSLRALRGEVIRNQEEVVRSPASGELRYRQVNAAPVRDANGNILGSVSLVHDITDLKKADEALRRSEERYHTLFSGITAGFALHELIVDEKGAPRDYRFLEINPAFERLTGLKREDVIGKTARQILPDDDPEWMKIYGDVALSGRPTRFDRYSPVLGRHYEVLAYRPAPRQCAVLFLDVTDRKRAGEKLEEAKRLLDAFMEYVPEGITIADGPESAIRMISRQGLEILGGPREGMPVEKLIARWKTYGRDGTTLLPKPDLPLTRALQKGETVRNEELVLVNAKGRRVTLLCNAAPIRSGTGDILGGIAAWRDISELKIAAEALHESDRRLADTLASISDAFVSFDCDWRYTYVNDHAERILRKRREEMLGRTLWEVFPESAESEFDLEFRRAVAEKRTISFEAYFAPLETWCECNCYPSRGGMSVCFRDVNERKRAAAVLQQTHDELEQKVAQRTAELQRVNRILRTISDCNQALVHAADEKELIETVCRTITEAGGYRMAWVGFAEHDKAKTVRPAAVVGFADGYLDRIKISWGNNKYGQGPTGTAVRTGQACFGHDFLNDPELAPWREEAMRSGFRSSIALPLTAGGATFGALTIYSDQPEAFDEQEAGLLRELSDDLAFGITSLRARRERDQVVKALQQKNTQLRALTLQLTQTEARERRRLAQVLHDHLQQLLVGARYSLAAVRSSREATKLELVRETMKSVDKFLGEAIETSRSLTQELSPPVLAQGSLAEAIKWLGRQFREKYHLGVRLTGDRTANIEDEQFRVAIFHALRELLFNVVKHAKVKSARIHLASLKDGKLQIVVSDKGVGFDPAGVLGREGAQGGFGLFSLRERMELLGGSLEMDSAPGRGSRIMLSAPLRQPAAGSASGSEPAAASRPGSKRSPRVAQKGQKIRVLIADDHAVLRDGLARLILEEADMEVVGQASDGRQAVELARRLKPDVVLMDVSMPKLNGVEATRILLAELPPVRIIGLSMFEDRARSARMLAAGAVAYLQKSGRSGDLVDTIRSCAAARKTSKKQPKETSKTPKPA